MCERVLWRQRDDKRCYMLKSQLNGVCGCVWKRNCTRLWMRLSKRRLQGWMKKKNCTGTFICGYKHAVRLHHCGMCGRVCGEQPKLMYIYCIYYSCRFPWHSLICRDDAKLSADVIQRGMRADRKAIFFHLLELLSLLLLGCRNNADPQPQLPPWYLSEQTECSKDKGCFIQTKLGKFSFLINIENTKDGTHVREMFQNEYILYQRETKEHPADNRSRATRDQLGACHFFSSQVTTTKSSGNEHGTLMVFSWDRDSRAWFIGFLSSFQ